MCGKALVGQSFHSIKTDKYGCGLSSVYVCGQKNVAKKAGAFFAAVAKTLRFITIRNLTVIRQGFKGMVSERKFIFMDYMITVYN